MQKQGTPTFSSVSRGHATGRGSLEVACDRENTMLTGTVDTLVRPPPLNWKAYPRNPVDTEKIAEPERARASAMSSGGVQRCCLTRQSFACEHFAYEFYTSFILAQRNAGGQNRRVSKVNCNREHIALSHEPAKLAGARTSCIFKLATSPYEPPTDPCGSGAPCDL